MACRPADSPPDETPAAPDQTEPRPEATPPAWVEPEPLAMDPRRVTLHRLNNRELETSLRALLSTELSIAERMPDDPRVDGFDNNTDALTLGSLHVDVLASAVRDLVGDGLRTPVSRETSSYEVESPEWSGGGLVSELGAPE